MPFIKFPGITNTYHGKFLEKFQHEFGPALNTTYVAHEKIHGANIQFIFEPNIEMKIASRNRIIGQDEDFYNVKSILNNIDLSQFQRWSDLDKKTINLYGEIFGSKIQNGIDYGPNKRILFFAIIINGVLEDMIVLDRIFSNMGISRLRVPEVARFDSWKEAVRMNTEFVSNLNPIEGNLCEGVVIQPLDRVLINNGGHYFILKKKNNKFREKSFKERKVNLDKEDPTIYKLKKEFESLINDNRIQSIFSKYGPIEKINQMGEYIKLVWQDAMNEFRIDYKEEFESLGKEKQKIITNVGSMIRLLLIEYL